MNRIQFYPKKELSDLLIAEAADSGVSVSQFVSDLLENYFGLRDGSALSLSELTGVVFREVQEYLQSGGVVEFDLNTASATYRNIPMVCGKRPSAVRASVGRSFAGKIGEAPFENVRKCKVNGVQKLSLNNALVYEVFTLNGEDE